MESQSFCQVSFELGINLSIAVCGDEEIRDVAKVDGATAAFLFSSEIRITNKTVASPVVLDSPIRGID